MGESKLNSPGNTPMAPRLLIIEPDAVTGQRLVEALGQPCDKMGVNGVSPTDSIGRAGPDICGNCRKDPDHGPCCQVLRSLRQLHEFELAMTDIVICAVSLPDGSGLDAMAYVRGMHPQMPVVLTGMSGDVDLAVEAIRAGAVDFLVVDDPDLLPLQVAVGKCQAHQCIRRENERLQEDLSRSLAELELKNRELETVVGQLEAMTRTDDLTGLANRRWLNLMLEGNWAEAVRNDLPLACIMIDLDGFKLLNDECGHQKGDEVLRLAGKVIQTNCRSVDTSARYGGDEFCIVMPHTEADDAMQVARRILREFDLAMNRASATGTTVSMSIGVAQIDASRPQTSAQLVKHADEAMYAAKAAGKRQVMFRASQGVEAAGTAWPTRYSPT